jgi:hypothetical protein
MPKQKFDEIFTAFRQLQPSLTQALKQKLCMGLDMDKFRIEINDTVEVKINTIKIYFN